MMIVNKKKVDTVMPDILNLCEGDAALYEELPALCLMVDETFRIRKINRFGCEQLGYKNGDLVGQLAAEVLCVPSEREFFVEKLQTCLLENSGLHRFEIMHVRKDGSQYWVRNTVRVIFTQDLHPLILIVSEDITETRYLIHELERQSAIDTLTGLCSRRRFDRELEQVSLSANMKSEEHALCFIDLDQFKVVNDSCGHQAGDELLRNIASLLKNTIRSNDVLARLGGDEFGLILNCCSINEAKTICEKILMLLAKQRFTWEGEVFTVGASIGLLAIDKNSGNATELLRQADSACYIAKDRGRNCVQIYRPDDVETKNRGQLMRWFSRLHWAFENNRFVLYMQKIDAINPGSESIKYYELLVRMRDYDDNLIMPGAFIPATEYYGLACKLDRWVARTALNNALQIEQEKANENEPLEQRIYFINLSGLTLGDREFIEEVTLLVNQCMTFNFNICFEITETAAIQNISSAIDFIKHFNKLGCLFALDDFGSGFSSFSYLKSLPVDFIKIDGEFIKNVCNGPTEVAVIKAIRDVADAFGKKTIAEYVENEAILAELVKLDIDYIQGFYIEKPKPMLKDVLDG